MTTGSLSNAHLTGLTTALAGRYRLERELGAGGMATVWLAEDVRHRRRVAIKVLHPELSAVLGPERFLKEIELTANLQHPHILPLFDSGSAEGLLYYVMPFVEGETLRARLERERQLPVADAVRIATEIASALDYAHRHGVVHRDIKPENILLQDGHVVVADFGIALAVQQAGGQRMTQTGLSLGTPQYMSPEQAMGERTVDQRADVYALGAVTYELLAGEPPFVGPTAQAIVARLLTETPRPLVAQRASVPAHVDAAVRTALEKLPADRFASAAAYAAALRAPVVVGSTATAEAPVASSRPPAPTLRVRAGLALAAAACVAAGALGAWPWRRPAPAADPPSARFTLELPRSVEFDNVFAPLTITHDGRTIIFRARVNDTVRLVRRDVDRLDVVPIPGTDGAGWPAVSPDDRWLAFRSAGFIRRVPLDGGPAISITASTGSGLAWATADTLVLGEPELRAVAMSGGAGRLLLAPDTVRRPGETLRWPHVLPDGNTVLYVSWPTGGLAEARIGVASLATGEATVLDLVGTSPLGVADGQLFYVGATGALMAVPFDLASRTLTGAPRALFEGIDINPVVGAARAALSTSGTLVYLTGAQQGAGRFSRLVTLEPDGSSSRVLLAAGNVVSPAWSPDGRRIAAEVRSRPGQRDVGVLDVATGAFEQITAEGDNANPTWSSDGRRIVFYSNRSGRRAIWWQPIDGSGPAEKLVDLEGTGPDEGIVSPDGRWLLFVRGSPGAYSIWAAELTGARTPRPLVTEPGNPTSPALSPDGRWLAFAATSAGRREVYVRPFPGPGGATQVSLDGGQHPVWSGDGRTLYFVAGGPQLVAASLAPGAAGTTMGVRSRRVLFTSLHLASAGSRPPYAVSPDGRRFVGLSRFELNEEAKLVVVTNWLAELRRASRGAPAR